MHPNEPNVAIINSSIIIYEFFSLSELIQDLLRAICTLFAVCWRIRVKFLGLQGTKIVFIM